MSCSDAGKLGYQKSIDKNRKRFQKIRSKYEDNPKKCKFCCSVIPYEKRTLSFCGHSCSASFNNKGVRKHGLEPSNCLLCGKKLFASKSKYCSQICQHKCQWNKIKETIKRGNYKATTDNTTLKKFLLEERGHKCEKCGLSEWLNKPIPLVCDHVNGNYTDNKLTNLRLICNNCDALSPTYKGRNKGKGRAARKIYRMKYKKKHGFYY